MGRRKSKDVHSAEPGGVCVSASTPPGRDATPLGYSRPLGVALLVVQSHLRLRRVQEARRRGFASECERLGVHAVMQVVTCPTEGSVVLVVERQLRGVASSPRQRLVLELRE